MLGEDAAGTGDFGTAEGRTIISSEETEWVDYDGVRYRKEELSERNFQGKPAWQRFLICAAGVLFNFLLAFILAAVLFSVAGYDKAVVYELNPDAPISSSGIQEGDEITGIQASGCPGYRVHSYRDVSLYMMVYGSELHETSEIYMEYQRDGIVRTAVFAPLYHPETGNYTIGITFSGLREKPDSLLELLRFSAYEVGFNIRSVIESLRMIGAGRVSNEEVMGPVGTVAVIGNTVEQSLQYGVLNMLLVLMNLCVLLSANLGMMNLLPIPALDGGRLLFILAEMLIRKRLNPLLEEKINIAGMILLLTLMVLIMGNDIRNLFLGVI